MCNAVHHILVLVRGFFFQIVLASRASRTVNWFAKLLHRIAILSLSQSLSPTLPADARPRNFLSRQLAADKKFTPCRATVVLRIPLSSVHVTGDPLVVRKIHSPFAHFCSCSEQVHLQVTRLPDLRNRVGESGPVFCVEPTFRSCKSCFLSLLTLSVVAGEGVGLLKELRVSFLFSRLVET